MVNQTHVAFLAFPFASHVTLLLNLTRRLAAAAPNVTFSFFSTAKTNASSFGSQAVVLDNLKAYDIEDGIPENHVFSGHPLEEIDLYIKACPNNFKKSIDVAVKETKKNISCVITDAFVWFGGEIAEEIKAAWVPLWIAGASTLAAHLYTDLIRQNYNGREDQILNFIEELSALCIGDLPEGIIIGNSGHESSFGCMLYKMSQMLPRAPTLILNTFEELDPAIDNLKSKFQHCLSVGPLTITSSSPSDPDETGCLSWLDCQKPSSVAYISFGTSCCPPPHELAALAEGIEESGVPFLWSLKDGLKMNLPKGFLARASERGMMVPWAPQQCVLNHPSIGVFVTHCGWNSVLESIISGVPMIFRPFFGDHMLNGRYVLDVWQIGLNVKDGVFSKGEVVIALETILFKEQGKKIRDKVGLLREIAKESMGPNGSCAKNFIALLEMVKTPVV